METFIAQYGASFFQLFLALLLGALVGTERSAAQKVAGMRTYGLVSLGACLFTLISIAPSLAYLAENIELDPFRIAGNIVVGVGFLGAGLIFARNERVTGLTTAAGLWVAAAIGVAVGFGLYAIAIFTVVLMLIVFRFFWSIEERVKDITEKNADA